MNELSRKQQQRTLKTEQWKTLKDSNEFIQANLIRFDERPIKRLEPLKTVDLVLTNLKARFILEIKLLTWEFDPGSGWTLAACLTHASRTKHFTWFSSELIVLWLSGGRVSNAWVTCLIQGDNSWKRLLIPHKRTGPHGLVWKTPVVWDGPASD